MNSGWNKKKTLFLTVLLVLDYSWTLLKQKLATLIIVVSVVALGPKQIFIIASSSSWGEKDRKNSLLKNDHDSIYSARVQVRCLTKHSTPKAADKRFFKAKHHPI